MEENATCFRNTKTRSSVAKAKHEYRPHEFDRAKSTFRGRAISDNFK